MTMPFPTPSRVALLGDVHGSIPWTLRILTVVRERGADVVLQLGDYGFWTDGPSTRKFLRRVEQRLTDLDLPLFWLDGNHEDHRRLNALPVDDVTGLRPISAHVHHLPRGYRWRWDGLTWLALGGATSLDRQWRVEGKSYWPEEAITEEQAETTITAGPADVMLCHDAPAGATVPGLGRPSDWPPDDVDRANAHRALIRRVVDAVRPSQLWHGHMHVRYDDVLRHRDGTITAVHGLSENDSWVDGNLVIVDTHGRPIADEEP